ncbi:hypothetical protein ASG42_28480 [Rhizobium sp. Leaf391]|uniref:hypothetical protein n=1 Tax=Rhizobium sp. Leaf391 TaxID=1736360 RepID=UPI000712B490|nr:hypothetical protein [Rhizobium sp. Leaf391]KQS96826.1 hypothetical protein ASG42_28480 [Rhizobium sp. Leaf391]
MTEVDSKMRRRRGASPHGEFEAAKTFATASEDARKAAGKKTAVLRETRQMVERDRAQIQLTTKSSRTIT